MCQHYWPESFRITDLCEGFVENGIEVDVLCGEPNYPKGEWMEGYGPFAHRREIHNGVKIMRTFEIKRGNNSNLRIFLNYITFPVASFFHIPFLLRRKYDRIFIYQLSPVLMAFSGIILSKIKKIETIMYVLDMWPQNLYAILDIRNKVVKRFIEKVSLWHYCNVDKIMVPSKRMRDYYVSKLNFSENNIVYIPQCCEAVYEKKVLNLELKKRFQNGFNIVFTGNISPDQSFETIINAAISLKAQGIKDINWIIVGDGMSRREVEDSVVRNGLIDNFFFEGFHPKEKIPEYMCIADALIGCLSKNELQDFYIPAKIMSYFAAGKPILLAMDGEVRDIVKEADCGYTCASEDCDTLQKNILKLYEMSENERDNLGNNAYLYHNKYFNRNENIKEILKFMFPT